MFISKKKERVEIIELNEKERKEYVKNTCPYNITLSHYLAFYWDIDVFNFGQSHKIWEWAARDSNGATPLHENGQK